MVDAPGTGTLLQRESDIMTAAKAASVQLAKVESETAARSKAVTDAYTKRLAEINEIEKAIQAALASGRTALSRAEQSHLLPGTVPPSRWLGRASDPQTSGTIREAQTAVSQLNSLADKLSVILANKRLSVPAWGKFFSFLNFAVGGFALVVALSALSDTSGSSASALLIGLLLACILCAVGFGLATKSDWARWLVVLELVSMGLFVVPLFFIAPLFSDEMKKAYSANKNDASVRADIGQAATRLSSAVGVTYAWMTSARADAASARDRGKAAADQQNAQALDHARQVYAATLASLREQIRQLTADAALQGVPWSDGRTWETWEPPTSVTMQGAVRLGQIMKIGGLANSAHEDVVNESVSFPLLVSSIPGNKHLVVKASGAQRERAFSQIQSVLFRLMTGTPAGQLQFTFVDPIGLGQNVAAFMQLRDYHDPLINSKAWTESGHIEKYLGLLTEQMEAMVQQRLRNKYADIEDYNAHNVIREPYRVLVVLDFPQNFTEVAARRLASIAINGPRCGFYTVVHYDPSVEMPSGFKIEELVGNASVWTRSDGSFATDDPMFSQTGLSVAFDTPPPNALADRLLERVGKTAANAQNISIDFEAPPSALWWTGDTSNELSVELGSQGQGRPQLMVLGKNTAIHVLVAGKTGSGKTTLLHTLVMGLAINNHPDELELYLIDFKKGVAFKPYATHKLPHARVIAIESEREFGLSALQGLDDEMSRRGMLFRKAQEEVGRKVDDLPAYRAEMGQKLPRILLVVDEFQEFFTEDDKTAAQAAQILDRLVRQGRGFGIHVLLGSQTLAGAYTLARSTIDQMGVRIALQCSEADSRLILADDNPAARRLSRPGQAIYNDKNGTIEGNEDFQVTKLDEGLQDDLLRRLEELATTVGYHVPAQHIFEGDTLADVTKNAALMEATASAEWNVPTPRAVSAWLGDPIAIHDALAATFRRQSGSNLLIVGQDEVAALGIMAAALVSLATQAPPRTGTGDVVFYVLDFTAVDGNFSDFFRDVTDTLPQEKVVVRRPQLTRVVNAIASEVKRRLENEDATNSYPPIFLVVYGLQRARDLRMDDLYAVPSMDSPGDEYEPATNPAEQFAAIVRDGPDVGVHTIVWCDTMSNLHRTLDRRVQREYTMKVAFQMSTEDSVALLDSPVAAKLGQNRAYFVSEDEGRTEKFRPYGLPTREWIDTVGAQLQRRPRPHGD